MTAQLQPLTLTGDTLERNNFTPYRMLSEPSKSPSQLLFWMRWHYDIIHLEIVMRDLSNHSGIFSIYLPTSVRHWNTTPCILIGCEGATIARPFLCKIGQKHVFENVEILNVSDDPWQNVRRPATPVQKREASDASVH